MSEQIILRFRDIIGAHNRSIMVVGAGATGSWFTMMATKQNYKCIVIDHDAVELHNCGTSIYRPEHVGKPKAAVLEETLDNVTAIVDRFRDEYVEQYGPDLIVSAVDSMAARREIYSAARKHYRPLIDMRVHYPYAMIFAAEAAPGAMEKYEATLYGDDVAWIGDCTRQNTPFLSAFTASIALRYASFPVRGYRVTVANIDKMIIVEAGE
jgi:flavin-dependent dehydrogenase